MTETTTLRTLLLPELEEELAKTRKIIGYLPDGPLDYKPHEKSWALAKLAGHTADIPVLATIILTTPSYVAGPGGRPVLLYETKPQLLAEFEQRADALLTAFKNTSDETFSQNWTITFKGQAIFDGTRYNAYRSMGINHMVHHRAQLGVYLRLLDHTVPSTFGPSADEPF